MKKFLLSLVCLSLAAFGYAAETTITFKDYASDITSDTNGFTLTAGSFTFVGAKGDSSNAPVYNKNSSDIRVYAGATLTVTCTEPMTQIVFNISAQGQKRLGLINASVGEIAAQASGDVTVTWTGNATEVVFSMESNKALAVYGSESKQNAQFDFDSVVISADVAAPISPISWSAVEANVNLAKLEAAVYPELNNPSDVEVAYSSSDEAVATVDADGVVTPLAVGSTVITATPAEETGLEAVSYTLNVVDVAEFKPEGAHIIFADQTISYPGTNPTCTWVAEGGTQFETSAAVSVNSNYPIKNGNNLRLYKTSNNIVTVNAPAEYVFNKVALLFVSTLPVKVNFTPASQEGTEAVTATVDVVDGYAVYTFAQPVASFSFDCNDESNGAKNYNISDAWLSIEHTAAINAVEATEAVEAVYYNLQGVRVANPVNGVFVKVAGNKAVKVVL